MIPPNIRLPRNITESPIPAIERQINDWVAQQIRFGPDGLPIQGVAPAHSGQTNYVLIDRQTNQPVYDGVRCFFGTFSVLLTSNEGNVQFRPGIIRVITETYPDLENEETYVSPLTMLETVSDLVSRLPTRAIGVIYDRPHTGMTITLDQWIRILQREEDTVAGGADRLDEAYATLVAAAQAGISIHLTDQNDRTMHWLIYDQDQQRFNTVP